jgi:hypothetical protein
VMRETGTAPFGLDASFCIKELFRFRGFFLPI